MPLDPPCTRKLSPERNFPRSNTLLQTVKNVSGSDAASTNESPRGTGRHCTAGAVQYSAYPPPATNAQTRSPIFHSRSPGPIPATVPAISNPGVSETPGGGEYCPLRCRISGRFTPAAATLTSTSASPGTGAGPWTSFRTSGPPGRSILIAFISAFYELSFHGREIFGKFKRLSL